jgi:hypothetical protein
MRDETVYGLVGQVNEKVNQIVSFIQNFTQSVRLDSTGKEVRLLALQKLLLKKGLITEAEMTEQAGLVIQEMQKQAEEEAAKAAAPAIVPATPEQTAQVANAPTTDAAVQEAVAPVVPPVQA